MYTKEKNLPKTGNKRMIYKTLREEISSICFGNGGYPKSWPSHRVCPCCNSPNIKYSFSKYNFTHDVCFKCDFVFLNPYPPEDIIHKLYNGQYYKNIREYYEASFANSESGQYPFSIDEKYFVNVVDELIGKNPYGKWLDVGGGIGSIVNLIQKKHPDWEVQLNEYSLSSIKLARKLYDIHAVSSDASDLLAESKKYDVISSINVVEHLFDPKRFFINYSKLIKSGGYLLTVLPQFTRLNASVSQGSSANVAPPFHLSLFNKQTLEMLLNSIGGLSLVSISEFGPAAFSLIEHVDFGDRWDIMIPTQSDPLPSNIYIDPLDDETSIILNKLGELTQLTEDFFATFDGRQSLLAIQKKI